MLNIEIDLMMRVSVVMIGGTWYSIRHSIISKVEIKLSVAKYKVRLRIQRTTNASMILIVESTQFWVVFLVRIDRTLDYFPYFIALITITQP